MKEGSSLITTEQLAPLAAAWAPTQRWYAGKGREATMTIDPLADLAEHPPVTIWLLHVDYADDEADTYQVPLVVRDEPVETLDHVLLGTVETEAGTQWVYDALHDKDVTPAWLVGIRDEIVDEPLRFVRYAEQPDDIPVDEPSLVLTGEQSNTSMVFGDVAILKVYRRLHPGMNPDIEVQGALTKLGAKHVPALLGAVEANVAGEPSSLAMLQEFMTTASDGWELAKTSVRDLMAEADLHADEAGGDFAGEAERLGDAVASVHADLATAFGVREAAADELPERVEAMEGRLRRAIGVVPELASVADALSAAYSELAELADSLAMQRIHGDLHLGQALRTVTRWVLIDFEGEPMAAMDARREFDTPLRDVAGMLRSFDYAGYHRAMEAGWDPQLNYRAREWSERNRDAFCSGYSLAAGHDPREHHVLLRALEADKAVYEAVYEARNRPAWLPIPLASLTRLATDGETL
ncbi:MAG TPA: aminoglycoside phosphotransferase [Jatrophihabitans sp.]|jgi:maltokinase|nr:aminoglycoside phosphotransferase [Jatrophihabitans sp.]